VKIEALVQPGAMLKAMEKNTGAKASKKVWFLERNALPHFLNQGLIRKHLESRSNERPCQMMSRRILQPGKDAQRAAAEPATGEGARNFPFMTYLMNCFYLLILPRSPSSK